MFGYVFVGKGQQNLEGSITILGDKGTVRVGGQAVNKIEQWQFADEDEDDLKEIEDDFVEFDDKPDATEIEPVEPERPLDDFEARLERLRKRREKLGGN